MLDMSWGEVMLIGGVALIVIGPKDLPKALRTVGQVTTKLRRMAGEFQMQFNEAIREAELDEVRKGVDGVRNAASSFNPVQTIRDELKGAVEGRAARAETRSETAPPADATEAGAYGPHRLSEPPAEPPALAEATARLKAEQAAAVPPDAAAALEAPPPVPGSVDDPFGAPVPAPAPAPAAARDGAAGR